MNVDERIEAVRRLCAFEGRLTGTDAERRAANDLAAQLREGGRKAEVEPFYVHPQWPLVQALHCLLALAGSLLALNFPAVGFAIVLVTAVSMYLELNGRFFVLRRLFFRRASQNVVARGRRRDTTGTLVLCANYDAGRSGAAYNPTARRLTTWLAKLVRLPFSPARLVFWSIAFLLPLIGLRMAEVDANWVSVLQLPPTLVLVLAIFLLSDIQLSGAVPGANQNASGVATVLSASAELEEDPPEHLDVWVVFAGAGDSLHHGMRTFVRGYRDELDRDSTWFLDVDSVGEGDVRLLTSQGPVVSYAMRSRLTELGAAMVEADEERDDPIGVRPLRSGYSFGSLPPALARYAATTVTCLDEGELTPPAVHTDGDLPAAIDRDALERAHRLVIELVRALDRDLARTSEHEKVAA